MSERNKDISAAIIGLMIGVGGAMLDGYLRGFAQVLLFIGLGALARYLLDLRRVAWMAGGLAAGALLTCVAVFTAVLGVDSLLIALSLGIMVGTADAALLGLGGLLTHAYLNRRRP